MIPGGIADKLGNRYEAKWVVRCLLEVLAGKVEWLQFENVDTEFQGFEFSIHKNNTTEWHQTKVSSPNGNWSIGALGREGILSAFAGRFSEDESAHCHFISQDNASIFHRLSEKARLSNDLPQFLKGLSQDQNDAFEQILKKWNVVPYTGYNWLGRSHIITISEAVLEGIIESVSDLYFQNGGSIAYAVLRDILEINFNKVINKNSLLSLIAKTKVLAVKDWSIESGIAGRIADETSAYLGTYIPFGAGGETIQRSQSDLLIQDILDPAGPELILLTGIAGSGKSGIVRAAISALGSLGVPHLAFRVDQYLECTTREALGKRLFGRDESPVSTLKGVYPATQSVLMIDQVDAISEVSGRDGAVKEVVFRLIEDAYNFKGVKVVVVCRKFDLESDQRLRKLKDLKRTKEIDVPLLNWSNDVEPILIKRNVPLDRLGIPQRRLLELPVNLAIFLEIGEPDLAFQSRWNLHERLIEKKQRVISKALKPAWTVVQALGAVSEWMSKRQQLDAPASALDSYPGAADILTSEGLIVLSRGRVNFFHESFFDHIFARSFIFRNQKIVDLLLETEQHLFRRTQVRQILDALRQNDFERYAGELSSVLFDVRVRFHIKVAVCQWLTTLDAPTNHEFQIVQRLDAQGERYSQLFRRAVLSGHNWFDLLNAKGWVLSGLQGASESRTDALLWWLSDVADEKPTEISHLLRHWWSGDPAKGERLVSWFGFVRGKRPGDDLLQLCCDVVDSQPGELFKDRGRDRITMMLHTWGEKSPEKTGLLLKSIFDAWFVKHPAENPFDRDQEKVIESHILDELLKKAPKAIVLGCTDALVCAIEQANKEGRDGPNWYSFRHRNYSTHRYGFDQFLGIYEAALRKVAEEEPSAASEFLSKLDPSKHECFMHIHLEVIQANPGVFAQRIPDLINNDLAFEAGWQGADWMSLAAACREAFPYLANDKRSLVEKRIAERKEEIEYASYLLRRIKEDGETDRYKSRASVIYALTRSGHAQWCILETIGERLLSERTRHDLFRLRRKFRGWKVDEPTQIEAHFVGSPIKRQNCERMSDRHWLAAIRRYDNDEDRRRGRGFVDGGARQLAGELQEATKKSPQRFSAFLRQIPTNAHRAYVQHILSGLSDAEGVSDEPLINAVRYAHAIEGRPYGNEIARLISNHPHIAVVPSILEALVWYALHGRANESDEADENNLDRETITIDRLIHRGGGLHIRGLNGERGWAWEALGPVLWRVPEAAPTVWTALSVALDSEMLISVRCCMMKPLTPLFNENKGQFESTLRSLVGMTPSSPVKAHHNRLAPLITHAGVHLFPYLLHWLPEFGNEILGELLGSGDENKELIAAWFVFGESFRRPELEEAADKLGAISVDHRRLLADVAGDVLTWAENANRAQILLKQFFFDEDKEVRRQAADVFRQIKPEEVQRYLGLTREFLRSPAFPGNSYPVLHMLENASCDVLDLVVEAVDQTINDLTRNGNQNGRLASSIHHLQEILKREYVSSERSPEARKKLLDMIDLMLSSEISGVESIVSVHDRW